MRYLDLFRVAVPLAAAAVAYASDVCNLVSSKSSIDVAWPLSLEWDAEQTEYWSLACTLLAPACILYPKSPEEVAFIVSVLRDSSVENFAIKSGGHNPNMYFASIDGRAIVSTAKLNEVTLDPASGIVRIGPGNRWDDVANALDGTGFTAVGGRIGNIGSVYLLAFFTAILGNVGGFLMGGGLSFMSSEYGWGANSVLAYELVLANSTILNVTLYSHPDLFRSLRGGGNEFGIVTAFTLQAYPQGQVWGGTVTYSADNATSEKVLSAINDFMLNNKDARASIIPTSELALGGLLPIWVIFLFYDGPTPPTAVFGKFLSIFSIINTCSTRSYADLLQSTNFGVIKGSVIGLSTETAPLPVGDVQGVGSREEVSLQILREYFNHWKAVTATTYAIGGVFSEISMTPVPRSVAQQSAAKGGDVLGMDDSVDYIVFEYAFGYIGTTETTAMVSAMNTMYGVTRDLVLNYTKAGWLPEAYLPLLHSATYHTQDFTGRLRPENLAMARAARAEVDPEGLWQNRTGGFKF
ncbi:FAD binding domain-containing protein [Thozetella sp. PMI_491]|nr:FAD binding domain-containing protein [Thozetella sp. PMI_491]